MHLFGTQRGDECAYLFHSFAKARTEGTEVRLVRHLTDLGFVFYEYDFLDIQLVGDQTGNLRQFLTTVFVWNSVGLDGAVFKLLPGFLAPVIVYIITIIIGTVFSPKDGDDDDDAGDDDDGATLSSYIEFANDAVSDADSVPGKIVFATSDADDAGTPTVRMTIDDGGNVGIGTPTIEGAVSKLTVAGSISGHGVTYLHNSSVPSTPTDGGVIYVESGA